MQSLEVVFNRKRWTLLECLEQVDCNAWCCCLWKRNVLRRPV